ncbi:MAG TPA: hypothetical protein VNU46_06410 [Gemmatimonadaceae bacterium]|nr:hypothetical protein [Gemmatimonadaceae bacterium]
MSLISPRGLLAQSRPLVSPDTTHAVAVPASLATITADTGAFAPGNRDFTRFTTPVWCWAAAAHTREVLRGRLAAQTVLDTLTDPLRDTIGAQEVAVVARACGARFTVAGTAVPDLRYLFGLAVFAQNDTLAQAVLVREVTLATTAAERDTRQLAALHSALAATPARVSLAEAIMVALDARGSVLARMQGHAALLALWETSPVAEHHAQQEEARILALVHAMPAAGLSSPEVGAVVRAVYRARLAAAFLTHPDSLAGIVQAAQAEPLLPGPPGDDSFPHDPTFPHWSLAAVLAQLGPVDTSGATDALIGHPPRPLQADFWFPAGGAAGQRGGGRTPILPVRGTVSLVVVGQLDGLACAEYQMLGGMAQERERCFAPVAARVRHWLAAYGRAGLSVTVVARAVFANSLFGSLTPAAEAARLRWFIQDYWQLPVTVAVQVQGHTVLPAPDGRRYVTTLPQLSEWAAHGGTGGVGDVFLTGRDGKLMAITDVLAASSQFDALLRWAMRPQGTS